MSIAFYAPMKEPNHPVPSGDRNIARALMQALSLAGADVHLASTFQSRDGRGDAATQTRLMAEAQVEVARLLPIGRAQGWTAWVSYHNYYKAPDLIGPSVARALGIVYIQIESTRAHKRLTGPWATFAQAAETAADAADLILYFTERDAEALHKYAPKDQQLRLLKPFIAAHPLPYVYAEGGPMLTVGMMRKGDKLASYHLIAQTLAVLGDEGWMLEIAGDGPARAEVEEMMAPFDRQVTFLGECTPDDLQDAYGRASLFFWPGVNEAFGMAYIEAQAAGLPVVAQDRAGMREVLANAAYPDVTRGAKGLSDMITKYRNSPSEAHAASHAAHTHATTHHMLPAAAQTLKSALIALGVSL